ncbi:hypothetical protein CVG87_24555 [Pseudomonas sp. WCS365]|nr:hypothetical protein CVG87_24555 [Pseudomonas sp. WCS365]
MVVLPLSIEDVGELWEQGLPAMKSTRSCLGSQGACIAGKPCSHKKLFGPKVVHRRGIKPSWPSVPPSTPSPAATRTR